MNKHNRALALAEATTGKSDSEQRDILGERVIHIGAGLVVKEHPHVLEALSTLAPHLGRWDPRDMGCRSLITRPRRQGAAYKLAGPCVSSSGR